MENSKVALEKFIEIMNNPNHLWQNGNSQNAIEERKEINQYKDLFKANANSYKKGQRILVIETIYSEKITRKNIFSKVPRTHVIREFIVQQPAKKKTTNQWVGDGYEDVSRTTIKYHDEKYIHTVDTFALHSVPA
jgi:hypothetical protein